jgi:hypothetical protein
MNDFASDSELNAGRNRVGRRSNVRFGSKADMRTAQSHVCFTPDTDRKSGHFSCPGRTRLKENTTTNCCWRSLLMKT